MRTLALLVPVFVVGCREPALGAEGESCTKRADCADPLGCFSGVCSATPPADGVKVPAEAPAAQASTASGADANACEAHARNWVGAWTLKTVATQAARQAWVGGAAIYDIDLLSDGCKLSGSGRRVQGDTETWTLTVVGDVGSDGQAQIHYKATGKDVRGTWALDSDGTGTFRSEAGDVSGTVAGNRRVGATSSAPAGGDTAPNSVPGLQRLQGPFDSLDAYCRQQATKNPGPETEDCGAHPGKGGAAVTIDALGRVEVFATGDSTMLSYAGLAITNESGTYIFPKVIEESQGTEFHSFLVKTRLRPDGRPGVLQAEFTVQVFETEWTKPDAPRVEQPTRERTESKKVICGARSDGAPGCKNG